MPQRQPQRIAPEGSPLGPLRVALLPLVFLCWSWAGSPALEPADDLSMMADEPFVFEPSVRAELVFDVPDDAEVGWGSLDLTAVPEHDDIRVDLLLGRHAERARWADCRDLTLVIDGRSTSVSASYAGVPMSRGAWDAMNAHVTIAEIRAMHRADRVEARVCGESLSIPPAQRRRLSAFVRRFDDIALSVGPSAPTPLPELGEEHEWFPPELDTTPSPA